MPCHIFCQLPTALALQIFHLLIATRSWTWRLRLCVTSRARIKSTGIIVRFIGYILSYICLTQIATLLESTRWDVVAAKAEMDNIVGGANKVKALVSIWRPEFERYISVISS